MGLCRWRNRLARFCGVSLVVALLLSACSAEPVVRQAPVASTAVLKRPVVTTPYASSPRPTATPYVAPTATPVPEPRYIGADYDETIGTFEEMGYRFSPLETGRGVVGVLTRVPMEGEWYRVVIEGDARGIEEAALLFYSYGLLPDPSLLAFLGLMTSFDLDMDPWFSAWRNQMEGSFTLYAGDLKVTTLLNDLETGIVVERR